jgi:flagellin FlaB
MSKKSFLKNDRAFTGLEAAIVLIAFVVVAAVFSYVMLGAGFFTSQKSKEVVHTGVDQATSSIELAGDLVGAGDAATPPTYLDHVLVTLQLTAGNNPVDISKTVISLRTKDQYLSDTTVFDPDPAGTDINWITDVNGGTPNNLLEQYEKVELTVHTDELTTQLGPNDKFTIEIKPPTGAILDVSGTVPPAIDPIMPLY